MHLVIAGATGLIGKQLTNYWLKQKHTITVIGRSEARIQAVFGDRVRAVSWNHLSREALESADAIVNLAGSSVGEGRWSEGRKEAILKSRIDATTQIATILAALGKKAPPLFNASAIGIYGLQTQERNALPPPFDEKTAIDWNNAPDFLSLVGRRWEKAAEPAIKNGVRVVFLRFGVVLAKEGGALPQIMPSFRYYVGGRLGSGYQPFCWVSIDDVVRAIDFLLTQPDLSGPVNIVSPGCVTQKTFADTLGSVMERPAFMTMPAWVLQIVLGRERARELLLEGQHVYPQRLLDMGFRFSYSDVESALNHIMK